ncbi:hypothetical protein A359_00850 [secondary endosymbiont of Ctenarytaina eucalypti]|uniref:Uncharacterized protein n=1 Tax=secondary endosymbiont of Ctenarytaina eucalypti TaxID=1199245 RepID=J3Z2R3_9ENTR|nr:hypothetical protein A359_00850 [secondary endosymbiont of Ctenarytaina eucalypti]
MLLLEHYPNGKEAERVRPGQDITQDMSGQISDFARSSVFR